MKDFRGFPPELFTFFEELEKDNSKSFSMRTSPSGRSRSAPLCEPCWTH